MIVTARGVGRGRGRGATGVWYCCTMGKLREKETTAYVVVIGSYSTVMVGVEGGGGIETRDKAWYTRVQARPVTVDRSSQQSSYFARAVDNASLSKLPSNSNQAPLSLG